MYYTLIVRKNSKVFEPIIFLILAILAVVGYFGYRNFRPDFLSTTNSTNTIPGWKIFKNPVFKYTLEHPGNYLAAPLCDKNHQDVPYAEVVVSTKKVNCDINFSTEGKLLMWVIVYDGNVLQDLLAPDTDVALDQRPTISKITNTIINGVSGKEIVFVYKDKTIKEEYVFVVDDKTYRLTQISRDPGDLELFKNIVSTFRFAN